MLQIHCVYYVLHVLDAAEDRRYPSIPYGLRQELLIAVAFTLVTWGFAPSSEYSLERGRIK